MVAGGALFLFAIDGPMQVLGPLVARDVYAGARTWGFASAAMGVGQMVGGLAVLTWRPQRPMLIIAAGMSLAAVPVALLALHAPAWTIYLSLAVLGVEWGSVRPVVDHLHAGRDSARPDLARVHLRLPGLAGVLPGRAGAGRAAGGRVRRVHGALGCRRGGRAGERVPVFLPDKDVRAVVTSPPLRERRDDGDGGAAVGLCSPLAEVDGVAGVARRPLHRPVGRSAPTRGRAPSSGRRTRTSSSWLPRSTMRPSSITRIWSA